MEPFTLALHDEAGTQGPVSGICGGQVGPPDEVLVDVLPVELLVVVVEVVPLEVPLVDDVATSPPAPSPPTTTVDPHAASASTSVEPTKVMRKDDVCRVNITRG